MTRKSRLQRLEETQEKIKSQTRFSSMFFPTEEAFLLALSEGRVPPGTKAYIGIDLREEFE